MVQSTTAMAQWTPITSTGTICGPLGSVIFQRGRFGSIFRSRSFSVRVPTAEAIRRMAAFAEASRWWSFRLTNDQRLTWARYAAANPLMIPCRGYRYLSGQQYFVRVNAPRIFAGQTVQLLPS